MAFTIGLEGLISSTDTGTDLYHLIQTGLNPYNCTLNVTGESHDITAFASTAPVAMSKVGGLKSWSGTFGGRFPRSSPISGLEGLVTYASGYVLGCRSWTITATAQSHDSTAFASTPPAWMSFVSGLYSFSGSFDAVIDDTTAIELPNSGAATFRLTKETTNDNTLAGNIVITGISAPIAIGAGLNRITYNFDVNGNLSVDGDSPLFDVAVAGTPDPLVRPEETDIVVRASGSRTYTGAAFTTGWTVGSSIGTAIESSVNFQGTGALAVN